MEKQTADALSGTAQTEETFDAKLREELIKALIFIIPTVIIAVVTTRLTDKLSYQPGHALFILIPTLAFLLILFLRVATRKRLTLGWTFIVGIMLYILLFSAAAQSRSLDWSRSLVGYERAVPSNFLALNRVGDWHYLAAPEEPANKDLVIVWMKPAPNVEEGRIQLADLIQLARTYDAKGVALDFYFESSGGNKGVDGLLCNAINGKKLDKPIPVFAAYNYLLKEDRIDRLPLDPSLKSCFPESNQGHVIGYEEADGRIRSIPLYFQHDASLESLSLKVARTLDTQVKLPDNGLLQFVKPAQDYPAISFEDLEKASDADRAIITSRFILVGENSPKDSFATPYGVKPGVVIHSYAIHSIRQNHFVTRGAWWVSLMMIFLLCYVLMLLTSRGFSNRSLILINFALSVFVILLSALFMYLWLAWIDLVYPLLASWLFLLILIGFRKRARHISASAPA